MEKQGFAPLALLPLAFGAYGAYHGTKNMYEGLQKMQTGGKGGGWQMAGGALQAGLSVVPMGGIGSGAVSMAGKGLTRAAPGTMAALSSRLAPIAGKSLPFGYTVGGASRGLANMGAEVALYDTGLNTAQKMINKSTGGAYNFRGPASMQPGAGYGQIPLSQQIYPQQFSQYGTFSGMNY